MALSDAINAWVEGHLAIKLVPEVMTELYVGPLPAVLNWGPLEAVPAITRQDGTALVADTDFRWATTGQLWPLLDLCTDNWDIVYTAGYTVVPDGLQAAIDQLALDIAADDGLSAERLGDYSYTLIADHAHRHLDLLNHWKRLMA